jgi:hypothetical protein
VVVDKGDSKDGLAKKSLERHLPLLSGLDRHDIIY